MECDGGCGLTPGDSESGFGRMAVEDVDLTNGSQRLLPALVFSIELEPVWDRAAQAYLALYRRLLKLPPG